jgi:hypothetical protein
MTTNVTHAFCRACGNSIDVDARFCGVCGAPVNGTPQVNAGALVPPSGVSYSAYDEVPWFRQRWFAVVCVLLFAPALLFLLSTGDIYVEDKGRVRPIGKPAKYLLMGVGALAIARVIAVFIS